MTPVAGRRVGTLLVASLQGPECVAIDGPISSQGCMSETRCTWSLKRLITMLDCLEDVVAGVEGELGIEDGRSDAKTLEEEAQPKASIDAVDK